MNRNSVLIKAIDDCLKEIYSYVKPAIDWEELVKENKDFVNRETEYYKIPKESRPSYHEFMGPKPYEFYYLPKDILKDIAESYIHAYRLDSHQELLDTINILKKYCKEPIVDKYIDDYTDEHGNHHPGYRSYDHPDNLEKELVEICSQHSHEPVNMAKELQNKFFEFLDMAGNFYDWNRDLNSFNVSVYLGPSPNSNKEAVIENWKKYRNQDIEIDEEQIKKDYYGEDELD